MPVPSFSVGEVLTSGAMNQVGLWLLDSGSVSGLTTSGHNITSVFSDDYLNYKMVIEVTATSTTNRLHLRMLSGTTPATTGYYGGGIGSQYATDATVYFQRSNNDAVLYITNTTASQKRYISFDIRYPFEAVSTMFTNGAYVDVSSIYHYAWGGGHGSSTSYNGIQLLTSTGTQDVTYAVYGYRN